MKVYRSNNTFKIFVNCQSKLSTGVHSESTWSTFKSRDAGGGCVAGGGGGAGGGHPVQQEPRVTELRGT